MGDRDDDSDQASAEIVVRDHREASRFEVESAGLIAFLQYERRADAFVIVHTEVPEPLRGKGIAKRLAEFALQAGRAEGLPIIVRCPFVRAYLQRHPLVPTA